MSLDEAYRAMGLSPGASPRDVARSYRSFVKRYHPDRPGQDIEKMRLINEAREVIESGGAASFGGDAGARGEDEWDSFRNRHGPQPSGNYTSSDVVRFAQDVLDKNLYQILYREEVQYAPLDAYAFRGGKWTYWRPFGSKVKTKRLPTDVEAAKLAAAIEKYGGRRIFDMVVQDREAWVTFETRRGYQSISFEEVKKKEKKPPGVGMKPEAARDLLRTQGLGIVAGGTKYAYWGLRGQGAKTGAFIRESKKTMRLVTRERLDRGITDINVKDEIYYGAMTPALLERWADWVKRNN